MVRLYNGTVSAGFYFYELAYKRIHAVGFGKENRAQRAPALRWMMNNVYVKTDEAGNIKPTERIDGAVALIMALDRTLKNEGSGSGKVYDGRDLLIL